MARNFNAKLRKEVTKNPGSRASLPQFYNESAEQFESRITIESLKNMIQTRQDYNRIINMLKRFSKKGAEELVEVPGSDYDIKVTKWQMEEMKRLAGIVNRKRNIKRENMSMIQMATSEGELGYTLGERFGMGLASMNKLTPTRAFTRSQGNRDVDYKMRSLLNETRVRYYNERDLILKNSYIKTLLENYNESDISDVIAKIRGMDADMFVLKFEASGDKFEKLYPPERGSEEYKAYVAELKAYWLRNDSILDLSPAMTTALLNI